MANTLKKIQTITVGSGGASSIEFTSIPQTYTDLKIVLSARSLQGNVYGGGALQFNSDTGSNYKWRRIRGDGSATASDNSTSATAITNWDVAGANATASVFATVEFYIPNYTSSNQKTVSLEYVGENNATEAHMGMVAGLWTSTSAITSIKLFSSGNNYVQYSTATLYGISNANTTVGGSGKATGGNQVYTDGTYWYHVFTSDGNFVPSTSMNVDYLVVAGGGAGGYGGGGAGGLRCTVGATGGGGSLESALAVTAQTYAVTVGAGGASGASAGAAGNNGNNSVFSSITSTAGGGGGGGSGNAGKTGGSGGGGGIDTGATAGSGTANQGYGGGTRSTYTADPYLVTGGGGGAGAVGGNATSNQQAGNGGNGVTTSISGTSTTYAGGGGGAGVRSGGLKGTGGTGGGGNAGVEGGSAAVAGTANTGGGGGGYAQNGTGAAGGSGIVIVRYAA